MDTITLPAALWRIALLDVAHLSIMLQKEARVRERKRECQKRYYVKNAIKLKAYSKNKYEENKVKQTIEERCKICLLGLEQDLNTQQTLSELVEEDQT